MKRTLLIASALLSIFFIGFYIVYFIILATSSDEVAAGWGVLAMLVMSPTVLMLLNGAIFNVLYNVKGKENHLLVAAIAYSLGVVVVYQIFYFSLLQALVCWFFWYQAKNQTSRT